MYDGLKGKGCRDNFKYVAYRSLHIMSSHRVSDSGDTRMFKRSELQDAFRSRRR